MVTAIGVVSAFILVAFLGPDWVDPAKKNKK